MRDVKNIDQDTARGPPEQYREPSIPRLSRGPMVGQAHRLHIDEMSGSPVQRIVSAQNESFENPPSHVAIWWARDV